MPTSEAERLNLSILARPSGLSDRAVGLMSRSAPATLRRCGASDDRRVSIAKTLLTSIGGLLSVTTCREMSRETRRLIHIGEIARGGRDAAKQKQVLVEQG